MRQLWGGQVVEASEYSRMFWWVWGASAGAAHWAHFCGPSTRGQGKQRGTFSNNHNHLTKLISFSPQSSEKGSFHKWRNWCSSRLAPVLRPLPRSLSGKARIQTQASLTWKPEISPPHNTAWDRETCGPPETRWREWEAGRGGAPGLWSDSHLFSTKAHSNWLRLRLGVGWGLSPSFVSWAIFSLLCSSLLSLPVPFVDNTPTGLPRQLQNSASWVSSCWQCLWAISEQHPPPTSP